MPATQTHQGGCHCGKVRYTAETDLAQVIECNCSICSKHGLLISFVPADKFTLVSGDADLAEYLFNKHRIHHQHCTSCGVETFAYGTGKDGQRMVAINVRSLDGVDLVGLKRTPFDGKSM
jgi:hypothetical protein